MEATISRLAQAMISAETEKRAWNAGKLGYREKGEIAMNPFPPGTADHNFWVDGFRYEKKASTLSTKGSQARS
ncbi:hypothetical protein FPY71_09565 [Aureimonas fodinaquatilis]|uniref:Uncharacterized protein n=1 Tax=Aureimonas fodinaquatilis TaxID=2565783 RepID=A0A5B0DY91_9HYPH|nr:hypothetical protein [Aureimonas fodinaquatilis]KAA0970721.1 hypothetical protein FPY71_09565 [Aureimonas fodinaquatilis]